MPESGNVKRESDGIEQRRGDGRPAALSRADDTGASPGVAAWPSPPTLAREIGVQSSAMTRVLQARVDAMARPLPLRHWWGKRYPCHRMGRLRRGDCVIRLS